MLNRIVLMGRLTRDPELRKTQSDTPVCSFSLAVDRDYKRDGEKETDFIDVVAWRSTAEGGKRRSAEVIADNVYFGDSKPKEDGAPSADADFGAPPSGFTPDFGDDGNMPF